MKTTKEQKVLVDLAHGVIRNYYNGSGQHTRKSADYVGQAIEVLTMFGLTTPRHYHHGNDAPRGGWQGYYVRLTSVGKNMKVVREAVRIRQEEIQKEQQKEKTKLDEEAKARLPIVCKKRLTEELSKNQKKRLNSEIRYLADRLNLNVPIAQDEFHKFVNQYGN